MTLACHVRQGLLLNALTLVLWPYQAHAESFNSSLLVCAPSQQAWGAGSTAIAPGVYELDVYINDEWKGKFPVTIASIATQTMTMKKRDVMLLGITHLPHFAGHPDDAAIVLDSVLHDGKKTPRTGELRLDLEIPQAWVTQNDKTGQRPRCGMKALTACTLITVLAHPTAKSATAAMTTRRRHFWRCAAA